MTGAATFISAGRFIAIDPWRHSRRVLPHDVLLMGLRGCLHIAQGDEKYELRFGDIIHLRADIEHFGYEDDCGVSYYWAHFIPGEDAPDLPDFAENPSAESALILFRQLLHFANRPEIEQMLLDYTLTALLLENAHQIKLGQAAPARREFSDILEWIRIHLNHNITLQDIASEFHYSPKYFSALFLRKNGMSFSEYLQEQRLNRACGMLLSSSRSVREVALACGYRDDKYFMKVFKNKMGVTAKAYRAAGGGVHMNSK